nr:signal peptidase II [Blattabacterium cuenoti]
MKKIFFLIFSLLIIDQFLKIYVKTHFELGSSFYIFPFFWIFFIENPGMAYGFYIAPGYFGKILLSIFRLILVLYICLFFYINISKKKLLIIL